MVLLKHSAFFIPIFNNPVLTLQLGILGKLLWLMGRIVKGCVREVSLAQVSCILMYVYVAPPTPVGAWLMALGLRQRFEYYYYYSPNKLFIHKQYIPFKARPFLDLVLENFKSYYQPHQHISIDESMISYKRSSLLHTVPPKKPHKWGLKAWVLADSTNGVAEGIYRLY